jgi:hypothetical protein
MLSALHRCSLTLFALVRPPSTQDNVYCLFTAKFAELCANKQRLLFPRLSSCTNAPWLVIRGGQNNRFSLVELHHCPLSRDDDPYSSSLGQSVPLIIAFLLRRFVLILDLGSREIPPSFTSRNCSADSKCHFVQVRSSLVPLKWQMIRTHAAGPQSVSRSSAVQLAIHYQVVLTIPHQVSPPCFGLNSPSVMFGGNLNIVQAY